MADQTVAQPLPAEDRQEWFWMLLSYMKVKTLALWLSYYPNTSYESFELIWPVLFDQMLAHATAAAVKKLRDQNLVNKN